MTYIEIFIIYYAISFIGVISMPIVANGKVTINDLLLVFTVSFISPIVPIIMIYQAWEEYKIGDKVLWRKKS